MKWVAAIVLFVCLMYPEVGTKAGLWVRKRWLKK